VIVTLIAILSLNLAIVGYHSRELSILERGLFIIAAALLFKGDLVTDAVGFGLFSVLFIIQRKGVIDQINRLYPLWRPGKE
jgi:TRAP-type uncharacterized transport system fused permease subunit